MKKIIFNLTISVLMLSAVHVNAAVIIHENLVIPATQEISIWYFRSTTNFGAYEVPLVPKDDSERVIIPNAIFTLKEAYGKSLDSAIGWASDARLAGIRSIGTVTLDGRSSLWQIGYGSNLKKSGYEILIDGNSIVSQREVAWMGTGDYGYNIPINWYDGVEAVKAINTLPQFKDATISGINLYFNEDSIKWGYSIISSIGVVSMPIGSPFLDNYWFEVKNTPGSWNLRKTYGSQGKPSDDIIKTVPNDWVLKVTSTTDVNWAGVDLEDGYRWYQVEDITDGAVGWMAAKNLIDGTEYLSYYANNQTFLEAKATLTPYQTKEARIPVIIEAVNNYYTAPVTSNSLYGGGGGLGNANNFQKFIQGLAFPKELILAIIAQESGSLTSTSFNNEIVTFDYGHGIMQSTFVANITNALANTWDNRGVGSSVTIPLCKSIFSDDYKKCYANSETQNNLRKPYQHYDNNSINPIYKQYANTYQSIYSNIKDGFRVIQEKYRRKCPQSDIVITGETFTCQDIERVLTVWGYNGFAKNRTTGTYTGTYLKDVAEKLESLNLYFPGVVYSDISFVQKMKIANTHKQVIKVYSPVTFSVIDNAGRTTGLVNNVVFEEIPNSLYERNSEAAVIFFSADTYKYRVIGTTRGKYGFSVDDTNGDFERSFRASDIPVAAGEIHEYSIDWKALARGERGVTVSIDINGDGTLERVVKSDEILSEIVPPTVNITSPTDRYLLNATTTIQFTASDVSGIASTTAILNGVSVTNGQTVKLTKPGVSILEVSAMDNEGNTTVTTSVFNVLYATDGFLPPVKLDGTGMYNKGRTIPVKFELRDIVGNIPVPVFASLYVAKVSNGIVGNDEIYPSAADQVNQFRYDHNGHMYIFNLSTDLMTTGTWQLKAVLDGGQEIKAVISIK